MVTRMTDSSLSIFVARNVIEQRDATARLVEAFQALVPSRSAASGSWRWLKRQIRGEPARV